MQPSRRTVLGGAAAGVVGSATGFAAKKPGDGKGSTADVILVGGDILTMDDRSTRASALAIAGERILAVGSRGDVMRHRGRSTTVVDLSGRTVVPGLVDGHTHAIRGGQTFRQETYWLDVTSLADGLARIRAAALSKPLDQWVAVVGSWHPNQFRERRAPTVADLDAVSPDHPVYVQYLYDYALVNTAGARVLGLDGTTPPAPGIVVERDAAGRATGRLLGGVGPFNALVARILPHTRAEGTASLAGYLRELSRCGVTGVVDGSAGPAAAYLPLFALQDEGRLTVRVAYRVPAQVPGNESEFFEQLMQFRAPRTEDGFTPFVGIGEALVFGANDGVRQSPGFVVSPEARAELREVATFAASRRLPLEVHAYTDDLASQILDAFEEVNATVPIRGLRWAMAHLNTGTARTISRMRRLGMTYSVQMGPYFEAPTIAETNSLEVAQRSVARIAIDQGVTVGGGSDATRIGDYRVWPALQFHVTGTSLGGAVQRPRSQLLTRIEALRMYTRGSTYLLFDEDDRGSLEPGKLADLAVLDRPYLTVPATQIGAIRSVLTLVGGTPVHDAERQLT